LNLLDNVETTWRGIQELTVQVNHKTEEENLLGLAISNVSFGLWCCPLKSVNKDPLVTPEKFLAIRKAAEAKMKPQTPNPQKMDQPFLDDKPEKKKPTSQDLSRPDSRSNHTPSPSQREIKPTNVFVAQAQNNLIGGNNQNYVVQRDPPPQNMNMYGGNQPQPQYPPQYNNMQGGYQYQQQGPMDQMNQYGGQQQMGYNNYNSGYNPVQQSGDFVNFGSENPDLVRKSSNKEMPPPEKKPSPSNRNGQVQIHDAGLLARLNEKQDGSSLGETTIIDINRAHPDQLNMTSFLKGMENTDKTIQYDAISDVMNSIVLRY